LQQVLQFVDSEGFESLFFGMDAVATVREIARQAGVSKTTVSMVLNNRTGVSEATRKRVRDAIDSLTLLEEARAAQEMAEAAAGALSGAAQSAEDDSQPQTILVLHPQNLRTSKVFHEIIRGVQAGAALYRLQLTLALNDPSLFGDHLENLYLADPLLHPKGVIVIGARIQEPVVDRFCQLGIPIVLVGRRVTQRGVSSVGRDEELVSYEATRHLIQLGHRYLAFLGGSTKYAYTFERLAGFRKAIEEAQLPLRECNILLGYDEQAAARLLLDSPTITGVVIINELFTTQVISLVQAAGRKVPDDLSVITFDDTEISRSFNPPLTSVSLPLFQEGFWAVRVLMDQIRHPLILGCQITLRASLTQRESCARPKILV